MRSASGMSILSRAPTQLLGSRYSVPMPRVGSASPGAINIAAPTAPSVIRRLHRHRRASSDGAIRPLQHAPPVESAGEEDWRTTLRDAGPVRSIYCKGHARVRLAHCAELGLQRNISAPVLAARIDAGYSPAMRKADSLLVQGRPRPGRPRPKTAGNADSPLVQGRPRPGRPRPKTAGNTAPSLSSSRLLLLAPWRTRVAEQPPPV
jgi:hypothetical protein